ncbi:MAG: DUF362 domain-containing protein [Gemmatimonadaceae bacterium]|nr:DUF362 domain-containing protein [Gemmatimonadaceae bacterium]
MTTGRPLVALGRSAHRDATGERPTYDIREVQRAVRGVAARLGWSGSADAPAFARVLPAGARVVVKPNLVLHTNRGDGGIEPLLTHTAMIRVVVEELLASGAGAVVLGDAPIQECDFNALLEVTGLGEWAATLAAREPRFSGPRDYRRTHASFVDGVRVEREGVLSVDRFVLYDLGSESLLEPISRPGIFRVTQYPPGEMERTHGPGRHQYLVARDIIEADVVVNLPKLKTHKKAGVTCALKNLIGINGNKEYLPHHRVGGASDGGDCYPGSDAVKRALEYVYDQANTTRSLGVRRALSLPTRVLERVLHERGDELGIEGSWSGNDTIWRTCLDLNRVLLYGRPDGTVANDPQRRVLHLVDAITAGHANGPLRPEPLPMGLVIGGDNAAAVDLVAARLLGYDPARIPIAAHAFDRFHWPLTGFAADEVEVLDESGESVAALELPARTAGVETMRYPVGWLDAVAPAPSTR